MQVGVPVNKGGEVTLNPKGRAFPQRGIRAHGDYANVIQTKHQVHSKFLNSFHRSVHRFLDITEIRKKLSTCPTGA